VNWILLIFFLSKSYTAIILIGIWYLYCRPLHHLLRSKYIPRRVYCSICSRTDYFLFVPRIRNNEYIYNIYLFLNSVNKFLPMTVWYWWRKIWFHTTTLLNKLCRSYIYIIIYSHNRRWQSTFHLNLCKTNVFNLTSWSTRKL